jgi:hypothetical protein
MRCRYCNIALAPLRSLADGEFCCDYHREAFEQQQTAVPDAPEPASPAPPDYPSIAPASQMLRLTFPLHPQAAPQDSPGVSPQAPAELLFSKSPELPSLKEALDRSEAEADPTPDLPHHKDSPTKPWHRVSAPWRRIRTVWNGAPHDLKLVTFVLPVLAALVVTGSFPKVPLKAAAPAGVAQVTKVVNEHWKNLNQTISDRAAISYADDFRSGLDAWESQANRTTNWSYDAAGFVRPGPLAIFKPTLELVDYRFEFLGEIDQKAMGWVFRAQDLKNYYAMKFVVVKPGPLPLIDMVRYAVIDGKEGPRIHKPLPMTVRNDMLYRVTIDVRGADFTVITQGQVVDFWTDPRLPHGGVGFFANRGERARLRWLEVSHQYDALGRVCAYLAPYGIEGRNETFN